MGSIYDYVWAVRGVRNEHIMNIIIGLDSAGFSLHHPDGGVSLRYINVDAIPFLDVTEREVLKKVATGRLFGFT